MYELTGTDGYYDVENGGRVAVTCRPYQWVGIKESLQREVRGEPDALNLIGSLARTYDKIWYFDPRLGPGQETVLLNLREKSNYLATLVPVATYPNDPERFAYSLLLE